MPETSLPDFDAQYGALVKDVFQEQTARSLAAGEDLVALARAHAARGKPDFVLAYLVTATLPSDEKRQILAQAFEQRALDAERIATTMSAEHARPFPLIILEARKDRTMAQQVRNGKMIRPHARAPKPISMQ